MTEALRDQNHVPTKLAILGSDETTITPVKASPMSHRLRVSDGTSAPMLPTDGLIGYWSFDEGSGATAYDSSGNEVNGTITGAIYVPGEINTALSFNGVDNYVIVPHNANQLLTSGFTLSVWVKPNSLGGTGAGNLAGRVLSKTTSASTGVDGFRLINATGNRMVVRINAGTNISTPIDSVMFGDGRWYFIVCTVDAAGVANMYINGDLVVGPQNVNPPSEITATDPLIIGARNGIGGEANTDSCYDGVIDEVRIYNKALSPSEINQIYHLTAQNIADRDENFVPTMIAVSSADETTPVPLYTDSEGRLLIQTT